MTLLALFAGAFAAATILPFSSEAMLLAYLAADGAPWTGLAIASAGNTAGSMLMWALGLWAGGWLTGRMGERALRRLERAQVWMRRWGVWALLLAWLPVIGDALLVAAGLARTRWHLTLALIAAGKTARYIVVIGLGALVGL